MDPGWGILAVRLVTAKILIVAGYRKLFVAGISTVAANFEKYSLPLPTFDAWLIALLETLGGVLLLLGFGTRILGALIACQFIVAGFWVKLRMVGYQEARLDLLLIAAGLLFLFAGPGRLALDNRRSRP